MHNNLQDGKWGKAHSCQKLPWLSGLWYHSKDWEEEAWKDGSAVKECWLSVQSTHMEAYNCNSNSRECYALSGPPLSLGIQTACKYNIHTHYALPYTQSLKMLSLIVFSSCLPWGSSILPWQYLVRIITESNQRFFHTSLETFYWRQRLTFLTTAIPNQ